MRQFHWWKRLRSFMMRRQSVLGIFSLMLLNIWLHLTIVDNQEDSGETCYDLQKPSKFFYENTTVLDLHLGNENVLASLMVETEMFVMFYAPWSVQCLQARDQFSDASSFFHKRVRFVAINCWYSKGTCRKKYSFMKFPTFSFYKQNEKGFKYDGIPRSDLLVRFVELMLDPIEVLNSKETLMGFLYRHEISAISFFDFASSYAPLGFNQFYLASLKFIESDPTNVLRFATTINSTVASQLSLNYVSSMSLIRGNECTHKYMFQANTSAEILYQWINDHRGEPSVKWLHFSKRKSLMLSSELKKGPALMLFLPYYPLSLQHQDFLEMRKAARAYYDCNGTISARRRFFDEVMREYKGKFDTDDHDKDLCKDFEGQYIQKSSEFSKKRKCCQFIIKLKKDVCIELHENSSFTTHVCNFFCEVINIYRHLNALYSINEGNTNDLFVCFEMLSSYSIVSHITICSGSYKGTQDIDLGRTIRQRNIDTFTGLQYPSVETCTKSIYSRWIHESEVLNENVDTYSDNFIGSGCHTNQSIRFYAIDLVDNDAFIINFGFVESFPPFLFFTDIKKEILNKVNEHISESAIVRIMSQHKSSLISSHFRNEDLLHTRSAVLQVTSMNFNELIYSSGKTTLMLYYSKWCGFCITFGHIYISLAEYFGSVTDLSFARINADSNDIHLQYSAPHYPSIVLFSRNNESIPYLKHYSRTLSSFLKFIQSHLTKKDLFHPLKSMCDRWCVDVNIIALRKKIRMILQKIYLLKYMITNQIVRHLHSLQSPECPLKKEFLKKTIQLEAARFLFKVLNLPITGQFLEKHKLALLKERFNLLRMKMKHYTEYY